MGNETSLHSAIKNWYSQPGDQIEAKVDGFIVDIVRDDVLIEVQTRNFSAMKKKLKSLLASHTVRLVYPIAKEKWIIYINPSNGARIGRRRSPRKGDMLDIFVELVRIPELLREDNFTIEVLMIKEEETRCADGKGSWRRRGLSVKDRRLVEVVGTMVFANIEDYLKLLPNDLVQPFTNRMLAKHMGVTVRRVRRITYCLRKMEAIKEVGRNGKGLLFAFSGVD